MEFAVDFLGMLTQLLVPAFALWAVATLHCAKANCTLSECLFYAAFLIVAALTVRTMTCNDGCWLIHTFSLGLMVVGGVTKRSHAEDASLLNA